MQVDHYTGGVDHSTVHLIYARYFTKVLNELGLIGHREPFKRFFGNGFVTQGGAKISKRVGGAAPDELIESYGADATRLSVLFIGPADQDHGMDPGGRGGDAALLTQALACGRRGCRRPGGRCAGRRGAGSQGPSHDRACH